MEYGLCRAVRVGFGGVPRGGKASLAHEEAVRRQTQGDMVEFIPIKPLAATESGGPGSYAGHSRFPLRHHGRPASTGGFDDATALAGQSGETHVLPIQDDNLTAEVPPRR